MIATNLLTEDAALRSVKAKWNEAADVWEIGLSLGI